MEFKVKETLVRLLHPPEVSIDTLPPLDTNMTLHLNEFRWKPAISKFDWPFTPNHKSSADISTAVGSVL